MTNETATAINEAIALLRRALQSECLTPYVEGCIRAAIMKLEGRR